MRRWWKRYRFKRVWKRREHIAFHCDYMAWDFIRKLNDMAGVWK